LGLGLRIGTEHEDRELRTETFTETGIRMLMDIRDFGFGILSSSVPQFLVLLSLVGKLLGEKLISTFDAFRMVRVSNSFTGPWP